MKIGIIVGLGLGIGIAVLSGCAPSDTAATAPSAAAPTPLVPEAYTELAAAAPAAPPLIAATAPAAIPPAQTRPLPVPAPAHSVEGHAMPSVKSDQYHPYWVVDVH